LVRAQTRSIESILSVRRSVSRPSSLLALRDKHYSE
jgi:hypothetical protein